jgi:hypothetical protein
MRLYVIIILFFLTPSVFGQSISMDRGVRVAGLWCFPLVTDSLTYLYLPNEAKIALDEKKIPQFSFVRYANSAIENAKTTNGSDNSITEVGGGGVLHFLVTYETPKAKIAQAEAALQESLNGQNVTIRGPIIFKEGQYALVSSIINTDKGIEEKKILTSGNAPVLEGSRIALSFELTAKNSKLLLESFKMATPDISLVFDFTFSGLSDAFDALITVKWSEIAKSEHMKAGASVYFVSGEVEKSLDELLKNNAISIKTSGSDTKMEALINNVYPKLTEMLFQPVAPEQAQSADNLANAVSGMVQGLVQSSMKALPAISVSAAYKLKDIKKEGSSTLSFNSRNNVERHYMMAFNIGNLHKKYGNDQRVFKTISLEDVDFQQREIGVMIDGNLVPEFDKLINNVTVTLRKKHENQTTTVREVTLTKGLFKETNFPKMTYNAVGDKDRIEWLNYEYGVKYSFIGGKQYETDWISQSNAMINVFTPYQRKTVQLEADLALLQKQQVRAVIVRLEYPFFGETQKIQMTIKPNEPLTNKIFDMTLPAGTFEYNYFLTWVLKDGTEKKSSGRTDSGFLFIDNLN